LKLTIAPYRVSSSCETESSRSADVNTPDPVSTTTHANATIE
jgi:hypothetical protein